MVWYGMVWYGMVWYGMVWYGIIWFKVRKSCAYGSLKADFHSVQFSERSILSDPFLLKCVMCVVN